MMVSLDLWRNATGVLGEDKKLIESLVSDVCFRLLSSKVLGPGWPDCEQKRESIVKKLVVDFFEDREKSDIKTTNENESWENTGIVEKNTSGNGSERDNENCEESTTGKKTNTASKYEINCSPSVKKISGNKVSGETNLNALGLTQEEEQEIKSSILLAYRSKFGCKFEDVLIKTRTEDDTCLSVSIKEENLEIDTKENIEGEERREESVPNLVDDSRTDDRNTVVNNIETHPSEDDTCLSVSIKEENLEIDAKENTEGEERHEESAPNLVHDSRTDDRNTVVNSIETHPSDLPVDPIDDINSQYYIDRKKIPINVYKKQFFEGRNPIEVLYDVCCQCAWPDPEFREMGSNKDGYLISVKVKDCSVSSGIYKKKRNAKKEASGKLLTFLGFRSDLSSNHLLHNTTIAPPWTERYVNCDSISLAREVEISPSKDSETDIENYSCKKKRRGSIESEYSNFSYESKYGRDILKRRKSSRDEYPKPKSRRSRSPEFVHTKSHYQEHKRRKHSKCDRMSLEKREKVNYSRYWESDMEDYTYKKKRSRSIDSKSNLSIESKSRREKHKRRKRKRDECSRLKSRRRSSAEIVNTKSFYEMYQEHKKRQSTKYNKTSVERGEEIRDSRDLETDTDNDVYKKNKSSSMDSKESNFSSEPKSRKDILKRKKRKKDEYSKSRKQSSPDYDYKKSSKRDRTLVSYENDYSSSHSSLLKKEK